MYPTIDIIWDTNCYREFTESLSHETIKQEVLRLKAAESNHNIKAFVNIYVLVELLVHLSDENDPAFDKCWRAVKVIWLHCLESKTNILRVANDLDNLLANRFFGAEIAGYANSYNILIQIAGSISKVNRIEEVLKYKGDLSSARKAKKKLEEQFLDGLRNFVLYNSDGIFRGWKVDFPDRLSRRAYVNFLRSVKAEEDIAYLEARKIARYMNAEDNVNAIENCSNFILNNFRLHIELQLEILRRLITTGIDVTKKRGSNFYWDMLIAASAVTGSYDPQYERFLLITSDSQILKAAQRLNCEDTVISLSSYLKQSGYSANQ